MIRTLNLIFALSLFCSNGFASEYNCLINRRPAKGMLSVIWQNYVYLTINDGTPSEFNRVIAELDANGNFKQFEKHENDEVRSQKRSINQVDVRQESRGTSIHIQIKVKQDSNEIHSVQIKQRGLGQQSDEFCSF